MAREKVFASFILDSEKGLDIALPAESVREATSFISALRPLPASIDFLEGVMDLRGRILPVINLKKRLKLPDTSYSGDSRIAVIQLYNQQFGLMVEDICDVLWVEETDIAPVNPALLSDDKIISSFIKKENDERIFEVLDLTFLFGAGESGAFESFDFQSQDEAAVQRRYNRFVAFTCGEQEYGLSVENAREVTFTANLNETFQSGTIAGDIKLRDRSVPVMAASRLFSEKEEELFREEGSRILIFEVQGILSGLIVDSLVGIVAVPEDEILPLPGIDDGWGAESGIYQGDGSRNMILLDIEKLLAARLEALKSVANISDMTEPDGGAGSRSGRTVHSGSKLVISENSYLVVSISKHFAFQLKDIQEIVKSEKVMYVPEGQRYNGKVINLRGDVLPVVNLREFYSYPGKDGDEGPGKLIICQSPGGRVAFEVDDIVTIYKQENCYPTPSLNPQLDSKRDTLDRLIEFVGDEGAMEHVLVINVHNLFNNYLNMNQQEERIEDSTMTDLSVNLEAGTDGGDS